MKIRKQFWLRQKDTLAGWLTDWPSISTNHLFFTIYYPDQTGQDQKLKSSQKNQIKWQNMRREKNTQKEIPCLMCARTIQKIIFTNKKK